MLTKYNLLISEQLKLTVLLIPKSAQPPFINIILNFILQFENYWMIINANPI